jgi:hypothetical protein
MTAHYRNLKVRARIHKEVEQAVATGQLTKLVEILPIDKSCKG